MDEKKLKQVWFIVEDNDCWPDAREITFHLYYTEAGANKDFPHAHKTEGFVVNGSDVEFEGHEFRKGEMFVNLSSSDWYSFKLDEH